MKHLLHIPFLISLAVIFFIAPEEATQGLVQKIFYIHVSSAITMYLAFFISFLSGILYLTDKKKLWDDLSIVGIELGMMFCTIVLTTGPIWARPIWGTWWTWEPRLTTTFLLFLMYVGYLVVRKTLSGSARRATICAVISIIAFMDVPLIHYSVKLWRGIHPIVINNKESGLPPSMQYTLGLTMVSMILLFVSLFITRLKQEKLSHNLHELRFESEQETL